MSVNSSTPIHRRYPSWREITQAKRLLPETTLVQDGQARALLITPDRPAYRAQAQKIQQAIHKRTGVTLPLHTDTEFDAWQPPQQNQILLGNLMDNRMVAPLYARHYLAADAHYPGPGGHVLRTVHDPWGDGHNVVFAGGSDSTAAAIAGQHLIDTLQESEDGWHLPPLLDIGLSPSFLDEYPDLALKPDEAFIQQEMEEAHHMLETGAHGGITDPLGRAGIYYHITGKLGWAELFKQLVFLMYEDFQKEREQYGGPWGMDADFRLHVMMPAWDLVEEAPVFSDEERLQITRIYAQFIEDAMPHAADAVQHRRTRHNHWTFAALGLLFSAQYFEKYYGVAEANDWLYVADECFVPQCHNARSHENSNGYQWLTLSHALKYALARPYPAFFDEGHVRDICDLAIISMDNLGYQSAYGDTRTIYGWGTEFPILAAAAWHYGDGRYQWTLARSDYLPGHRIGVRNLGGYRTTVEPVEPTELTGVVWHPLDRGFHTSFNGEEVLPLEAAYDKVVFRPDFDSESEYLLLDGLAVGGHKHYDCNALIRLTALDRIWLADGDYYCSAPNFHNGVLPLCGGRTSQMPPFTWREHVVDLPSSGFSRTTVKEYGNSDWERNILWRKGRYFLVADVMRAHADEAYDFRALWHVVGDAQLADNRLLVRQQDRLLEIVNLDGAAPNLTVDTYTSANWDEYEHADPPVKILQQNRSSRLENGAADLFLNLLHPRREDDAPLAARRLDQGSVLVAEEMGLTWLGTRISEPVQAPCQTDAALWAVTAQDLALVHVTEFGHDGPILQAEHPVDIEFDLASGRGAVTADLPTLLTFHNIDATALQVDHVGRALRREDDRLTFSVPPGRHTFTLSLAAQPAAIDALRTTLEAAWSAAPAATAAASDTARTGDKATPAQWQIDEHVFTALCPLPGSPSAQLAAGTESGDVLLMDAAGQVIWRKPVGGAVTTVTSANFGAAGTAVVAGSTNCTVTAFTLDGEQLWQFQAPFYKRDGIIRVLLAADLNGDGQDEVIAGAENWHYYTLDSQGRKLWQFESVHASTAGAVADVDHDGAPELIAATEYYWWFGVSAQGEKKWQHNTIQGPGVNHVASAAQPDGTHLVAFGCRDGTVQVVDAQGALQFVLQTGDAITGLAAADLDGDGAQEFLVASAIQNTYALNGDGTILWRVRHQTAPTHLLLDRTHDGTPRIVVAETNGRVQWLDNTGDPVSELWMGEAATVLTLLPVDNTQLVVAALSQGGLRAWQE